MPVLVYENTLPLSRYQLQLNCKTLKTNALLNGLIYEDNNIEDDDIEMGGN
jgi:hypothetical protein